MVTHSSILAWRISWAEEPGGVTKSLKRLSTAQHTVLQASLVAQTVMNPPAMQETWV